MSLALTVTPGVTFTPSSRVTDAMLNAAALPVVQIPNGSITGDLLDEESIVETFGDVFRTTNWLPWGTIDSERFAPDQPVDCPAGIRTENPRGWFVTPSGADVQSALSLRDATSQAGQTGRTGVKVFGASGLTWVRFGTWLPSTLTNQLQGGTLTFSIYVFAVGLASAIVPVLHVLTPSSTAVDEGLLSERDPAEGETAVVNDVWTRLSYAIDATAVPNWSYGARLELEFTVAVGKLDSATDFLIFADAQIDKGVETPSAFLATPPHLPPMPSGTVLPMARSVVPGGWLLCDGSRISKQSYARLWQALGHAYFNPDNGTLAAAEAAGAFDLPDGRGRTLVGKEDAASLRKRLEVLVDIGGSAGAVLTIATGASTGGLRLGMGAYGTNLAGETIIGLSATEITLSGAPSGTVAGTTARFSKLGARSAAPATADPEELGAAGDGMSYGRNEVKFTQVDCSATAFTLTVKGVTGLATGMTITGEGIPPNTKIVSLTSATTIKMNQSVSGTIGPIVVTFGVDEPEGNQWERYQYLLRNPTLACYFNNTSDSSIDVLANGGLGGFVYGGMSITTAGSAVVPAGTYVSAASAAGVLTTSSAITVGVSGALYELSFSGGTLTRTPTPTPDMLPGLTVNWMIKT